MHVKVYCPDIECDSCARLLKRSFEKAEGIVKFEINKESIDFEYNRGESSVEMILKIIRSKGFRASLEPFIRKNFKERLRDFRENKSKYELEYRMLNYLLFNLFCLLVFNAAVYLIFLKNVPDFLQRYGWWAFYTMISIASIGTAMWHFRSYKGEVTSMTGMMIGMTFGMQTGLMIGTIIGATNGIFIGSMAGMLSAVIVGIYNGKCCGIMGILEGVMAGLMGGTMGGMIGVMMFADHILWFMPFFFLINIAVIDRKSVV